MSAELPSTQPSPQWEERLRVIEARPLGERAAAYAELHDELTRQLEAEPVAPPA